MVGAETSNLAGACAGFRGVPLAAPVEVHLSLSDCKFLKIFIYKTSKELYFQVMAERCMVYCCWKYLFLLTS